MQRPTSPPADAHGPAGRSGEGVVFPRIPGYRLQKRLGEGGMAAVYLATQESLDRLVAIKVMERAGLQDEVSKQRFENEARTIAQLSHPCIVAIYEVGRTVDGRMYYIMPFLANGDLSQRKLRDDEAAILRVLRALLSALDYAHQRGIVHRDVKAANVLYDVADRPLLTDFGIAMSKRDTSRITTAGVAVGSSGYMAPEQARGDIVDGRADLYSVGVLTYELLTGHLPYEAPDALALALMHAQNPIPRLPTHKRHWQFFIDKAMAKSADQRYATAQQMLDATTRIERRQRPDASGIGKHSAALAAGAGIALLAVGLYASRNHLPWSTQGGVAVDRFGPKTSPKSAALVSAIRDNRSAPASKIVAPLPVAKNAGEAPSAASDGAAAPDSTILAAARDAIAHGNLTTPADTSAVQLTHLAWKLSPNTDATRQLAAETLKALAERQAQSIVEHHDPRVLDDRQVSMELADSTVGRDAPVWRSIRTLLVNALDRRVQAESSIKDVAALKRTETLARQIDLSDVYRQTLATAARRGNADSGAASALAALGPGWLPLPQANPKAPLAAISQTSVTRHEYALFVNATRRPASACNGAKPAPAGGRKTWSDPGFVVTSEQPVVCVSWSDATAYAAWLSAQKGQHYRLPAATDWQAAKGDSLFASPQAEWLSNRSIAGRDVSGHDSTQGFDDVGFRVVRVLDGKR